MNKSKPVLMIHEVTEDILSLPLHKYTLTFDDGLYSQYFYWNRIKDIPTEKLFFISTAIINADGKQSTDFPTSVVAHQKAKDGNFEDFMTVEQIQELARDPMVTIGGHGHMHLNLREINGLYKRIHLITEDTTDMLRWFDRILGTVPGAFAYPYNNDSDLVYKAYLAHIGFTKFYGEERVPVEQLLASKSLPTI